MQWLKKLNKLNRSYSMVERRANKMNDIYVTIAERRKSTTKAFNTSKEENLNYQLQQNYPRHGKMLSWDLNKYNTKISTGIESPKSYFYLRRNRVHTDNQIFYQPNNHWKRKRTSKNKCLKNSSYQIQSKPTNSTALLGQTPFWNRHISSAEKEY